MLEFKDEMLIPNINGEVYYGIYELENWLRRICLTIYMTKFGPNWTNEILDKRIEKIAKKNEKLLYLGADIDDNIIWAANQGQLMNLLTDEKVKDMVEQLLEFKIKIFDSKLNELREIRNILAHNRALSPRTEFFYKSIYEALQSAIINFKKKILYDNGMEIKDGDFTDKICKYFNQKMNGNNWSVFQAYIANRDNLYSLVCLPVKRNGRMGNYIDTKKLIKRYKKLMKHILAFHINKTGDEYSVLFTSKSDFEKIKEIIDIFVSNPEFWTTTSYINQDPRYACNPKIWYYENRQPDYDDLL